jgi:hypothetical protein
LCKEGGGVSEEEFEQTAKAVTQKRNSPNSAWEKWNNATGYCASVSLASGGVEKGVLKISGL